jgi:hypothetical protein
MQQTRSSKATFAKHQSYHHDGEQTRRNFQSITTQWIRDAVNLDSHQHQPGSYLARFMKRNKTIGMPLNESLKRLKELFAVSKVFDDSKISTGVEQSILCDN